MSNVDLPDRASRAVNASNPIIYLFVAPDIMGDLVGYALAEDGVLLASSIFPTREAAHSRMDKPCRACRQRYPDGYQLLWVDDIQVDGPWREPLRLQKAAWDAAWPERAAAQATRLAKLREERRVHRDPADHHDVTAELEALREATSTATSTEEEEDP